MRKYITGSVLAAFAVLVLAGCTDEGSTVTNTAPEPTVTTPAYNVDPRTPEQRFTDQLSEAGFSFNDPAKAVRFGRLVCQLHADGNAQATILNSIETIVQNSQTASGRASELDTIATRNLCPEYK